MALIAKKTVNTLPLLDEGMHCAVCQSVIDLGHQHNEKFNKTTHKVLFIFELPYVRMTKISEDGKVMDLPRVISKQYNMTLHEKSMLAKDLKSWRGRSFTKTEEDGGLALDGFLGKSCTLQVLHAKKGDATYANIAAILPLMPGADITKPENPVIYFCFADHRDNIPEGVPAWIEKLIENSDEWQALNSDVPISVGREVSHA